MRIPSSEKLAELLDAMGIAKNRVAGFTIEAKPHSAAVVIVEVYVDEADIQTLTGTIKKYYKLVPQE